MHWQDAAQASPIGIATRQAYGGRVQRHADGTANQRCMGYWVPANTWDIEGFTDWEPVQPQPTEASE